VSLSALVQEMVDAGATPQLIAIAVRAVEAAGSKDEARKAKDRERKRLSKEFPRNIQGTSAEIPGTVPQVSPPIENITLTPASFPSVVSPRATPRSILLECLSPEMTGAVIDHRRAKRSPLTLKAAQLLAAGFLATGDPNSGPR